MSSCKERPFGDGLLLLGLQSDSNPETVDFCPEPSRSPTALCIHVVLGSPTAHSQSSAPPAVLHNVNRIGWDTPISQCRTYPDDVSSNRFSAITRTRASPAYLRVHSRRSQQSHVKQQETATLVQRRRMPYIHARYLPSSWLCQPPDSLNCIYTIYVAAR